MWTIVAVPLLAIFGMWLCGRFLARRESVITTLTDDDKDEDEWWRSIK